MKRGGKRQRRRRIKSQIVGARICAAGRWHHFCLSRGHGFRCPRGASWDGPWRLTRSRRARLTSSRFTALPCHGEIFAAAASLLPNPARDGQRTVVSIMSLWAHASPSMPSVIAFAAGSMLAPASGGAALRRRCRDASGSSWSLYKCTARIMRPQCFRTVLRFIGAWNYRAIVGSLVGESTAASGDGDSPTACLACATSSAEVQPLGDGRCNELTCYCERSSTFLMLSSLCV